MFLIRFRGGKMFKLRKVTGGGTKLVLDPKKSDYVDFSLYIGVGQKDNVRYNETAHLLEHMVGLNCDEFFDDCAIELKAETWFDFTKYYFKSKKEDFNEHFDFFIDKLVNFTIDDDISFENEKKVIDVEMNMLNNRPISILESITNMNFENNYISNIEEDSSNLLQTKDISKEYLLVFFNKHYTADNMVVSLQTDDENIIKHVEQGLEKLSKLKRLFKPYWVNEKQEEPSLFYSPIQNYFVTQTKSEDAKVIFRIPSVSKKHKLYFASLLYSSYLTISRSPILLNELRGKRGLIYAIFSDIIEEGNLNFLEISYHTFSDNVKKVNGLIRRVIDDIAQKGLTREEFEKLKKDYIKRSEYYLDSNSEICLNAVCIKLLNSDKIKGIGLNKEDYLNWVKNTTLEEFNSYAKHISKIKNYFVIGSGKNMSRKDLMSFKNLKQKDYKNDYYYENMLTQGEKREYIKTLQASGVKNLAKQERGLVENKKYTMKSEEQEK